jgi:hypothetical protein
MDEEAAALALVRSGKNQSGATKYERRIAECSGALFMFIV